MIWQVNKRRTMVRWYRMSRMTEFNQNTVDWSVCDVTVNVNQNRATVLRWPSHTISALCLRALHELYEAEWLVWFDMTVVIWSKDEWCGVAWRCEGVVWCEDVVWRCGVVWCDMSGKCDSLVLHNSVPQCSISADYRFDLLCPEIYCPALSSHALCSS